MRDRVTDILKLLICFVVFFCIGDISSFILRIFGIDMNNFSTGGIITYQFIVSLIMFILLLILYYKKFKEDFIKFKENTKDNINYIIKAFIIFMILKYLVGFVSIIILMIFGYDTSSFNSANQELIESFVRLYPIIMIISSAFLAPMYEEGIFRLGIKSVIKNKWLFIIISGLIFGLMHIFPLDEGVTLGLGFLNNLLSILVMINMS